MKTTIFYENSYGIMAKWSAEVMQITDKFIDLKFSKSKALRFAFDKSDFILVTKKPLKDTNFFDQNDMLSFSSPTRKNILKNVKKDDIDFLWNPKNS